jgi:hypothetical protein
MGRFCRKPFLHPLLALGKPVISMLFNQGVQHNGPDFSGPLVSGTPRLSVFVVPSNHLEHITIFLQSKTLKLKHKS